ncbi:MAG: tRNA (guanosine(37)-N1)-methyltransferase TrmD [Firmicutes bacterium]|nr:tRNA (guanosine(37)-N1)-methyltransferase TrmD [Bacillota bacterium]MBR0113795.1 tRNA (guanosine(37)-N1)-methyltransferase TrmD [Bacillota bacterium]MBR0441880.1 tRNA (guanosine(37)-N1)-methyltransferase TrmD [Bacillota bacterium]
MKITILTQFPEMFVPVLGESILGRASKQGILEISVKDVRDYSADRHRKTDDTPFGGGAGMLMAPQPAFDALRDVGAEGKRIIYMSPRGPVLDQKIAEDLAKEEELFFLCGHYEGVDQRIIDRWNMEELSIGDYILTGGELACMVVIDCISRLIPGVLGSSESLSEESIYSGLLEYDQYTKPREFEGMEVPEVLYGGNHRLIHLWQFENSLRLTRERRPDLFEKFLEKREGLTKDEKKVLDRILSE